MEAGNRKVYLSPAMRPATVFILFATLAAPALASAQEAAATPDVGFVATPMSLVAGMLDLAGVARTDTVYDLGSGDGRIVIAAARRGARAVGVELDPVLVAESRASADSAGVAAHTAFRQADLFTIDLRPATVVTLYLGRALNQRLRPIFLRDLRPGTRIVSQAFDMADWQPDSVVVVRSREVAATPIHLWLIPASAAGRWSLTVGSGSSPVERLELRLRQRYQFLGGDVVQADSTFRVSAGRLRGDSLTLSAGERRFAGRIAGDEARGTVTTPGTPPRPWRAVRTAQP